MNNKQNEKTELQILRDEVNQKLDRIVEVLEGKNVTVKDLLEKETFKFPLTF